MEKKIVKIDMDDLQKVTGGRENFRRNSWAKRFTVGKKVQADDKRILNSK